MTGAEKLFATAGPMGIIKHQNDRGARVLKKLLIGCGVLLILAFILVAGGLVFVGIKMRNWGRSMETMATQIQETNQLYPFQELTTLELDEQRVRDYFAVRQAVIDRARGNRTVTGLINAAEKGERYEPGMREMFYMVTSFLPEMSKAFRQQLDERNMSMNEYEYITRAIYTTIVEGEREGRQDMTNLFVGVHRAVDQVNMQLAGTQMSDHTVDVEKTAENLDREEITVPEKNFDIVAQYEDQILEYPWLSFLEFLLINRDRPLPPGHP